MQEYQSDDFFIPAFLMKMSQKPESNWCEKHGIGRNGNISEDFLKGIQGWAEYFPADECDE